MKTQTKKDIKFAAGVLLVVGSVIGFCITFNPFFIAMHLAGWIMTDRDEQEDVYKTTEYINHK